MFWPAIWTFHFFLFFSNQHTHIILPHPRLCQDYRLLRHSPTAKAEPDKANSSKNPQKPKKTKSHCFSKIDWTPLTKTNKLVIANALAQTLKTTVSNFTLAYLPFTGTRLATNPDDPASVEVAYPSLVPGFAIISRNILGFWFGSPLCLEVVCLATKLLL